MRIFLGLATFLLATIAKSNGYFITVDAHSEECFFEEVEKGTAMGLVFETSEGGFLDIDIKVLDPDGKIIYQGERESNGKFTFSASKTGVYTYCFGNQMSSMTPKTVMFNMEVGEPPSADHKDGDHNSLESMIDGLKSALRGVKHEQEYMTVRDRIHHDINEATNSRVVLWSVFEAMVLITMTIGQVYYLKRFFEVRRVI